MYLFMLFKNKMSSAQLASFLKVTFMIPADVLFFSLLVYRCGSDFIFSLLTTINQGRLGKQKGCF